MLHRSLPPFLQLVVRQQWYYVCAVVGAVGDMEVGSLKVGGGGLRHYVPHCVTLGQVAENANLLARLEASRSAMEGAQLEASWSEGQLHGTEQLQGTEGSCAASCRAENSSFLAHPDAVRKRLLKLAHQYPLRRQPASPPHGRS
jgi:hypothetical protein